MAICDDRVPPAGGHEQWETNVDKESVYGQIVKQGLGVAAMLMSLSSAHAAVVYSNMYNPLPGNTSSYGYAANSITELDDKVTLGAGPRTLQSITLTMSDWAVYSSYASYASNGYNQALTLYLYDGVTGNDISSKTITSLIPWRPEATDNCSSDGYALHGYGSNCYHGIAFNVTFDFTGMGVVLPDDIYFGLSFNTQAAGYEPTGMNGPYNQLNLAIGPGATVGRLDGADGYSNNIAAQIVTTAAIPEPSTVSLFGLALVGLVAATRRRKAA